MPKLIKGNTYLCKRENGNKWYIVHQSGQRSWTASVFTEVQTLKNEDAFITMNGTALFEEFKNGEMRRYNINNTTQLRKDMFNILKWGQFDAPKDNP